VLGVVTQVLVVLAVVIVGAALLGNLASAMRQRNLSVDLGILERTAGFDIAESLVPYEPTDSFRQALLVGLLNTLLVSAAGIVLATLLGLVVGIARLSSNWLVSRIAAGYVELFRNTPLLVQLFLIYFGVFIALPPVRESIQLPGSIFLNQRGVFLPRPIATETFTPWLAVVVVAFALGLIAWIASARLAAAGRPTRRLELAAPVVVIVLPVAAWALLSTAPIALDQPVQGRFNFTGGTTLSPEFSALLLSLVLYTAAFIGEIVRGGIQSVSRGQVEAARSIGLGERQVLGLIVLPQALRVIVPPLTSQYLNLVKNSSLAIAIGYPDLFNVSTTIANITGQPVAIILVVMATYLAISLATSLLMNLYNRRVQIRER
jgi:general L-amino acid transport system permease protein